MAVPGRVEAARLLLSLDPPPWLLRHSRAVGEVAAWLARRIAERGIAVQRHLVESAALLHDLDKAIPRGDAARALPHGDGSAAWLSAHGYPELARPVASHPVTRLVDGERYRRWSAFASLESMAQRFASWERRYPDGWSAEERRLARARAERLEADVCSAAGVRPEDVGRLRWTSAAICAARHGSVRG